MLPSPLPNLPCSGVPLSGASPARPGGRTAENAGILHSWSLPQPLAPLMLAPLEALEAVRWGGSGKDDAKGRGEGGGRAASGWPAPTPLTSALQQLQAWASATAAAAADADVGSGARPASGAEGLSATTGASERAGKEGGGVHFDRGGSSKAPAASVCTQLPAVSPQHDLERSEGTAAATGGAAGLATGSCSQGLHTRQGGGCCPTDRAEHGRITQHHRQAQWQGMPGAAAAAGLPEPHASGAGGGCRAQGHGIQGVVSSGSPRVRAQAAVRSECASLLVQAAEQRSQCVQQALQTVGRALEADRCVMASRV